MKNNFMKLFGIMIAIITIFAIALGVYLMCNGIWIEGIAIIIVTLFLESLIVYKSNERQSKNNKNSLE